MNESSRQSFSISFLHGNNKDADQPVHPCIMISAFVVLHDLENTISELATCKISSFYQVYVAGHVGLSMTRSQILKTGFLLMKSIQ